MKALWSCSWIYIALMQQVVCAEGTVLFEWRFDIAFWRWTSGCRCCFHEVIIIFVLRVCAASCAIFVTLSSHFCYTHAGVLMLHECTTVCAARTASWATFGGWMHSHKRGRLHTSHAVKALSKGKDMFVYPFEVKVRAKGFHYGTREFFFALYLDQWPMYMRSLYMTYLISNG
jgi:hypothetical protein